MTIRINTEYSTFDADKPAAVAVILRELADRLLEDGWPKAGDILTLRDVNGNVVGVMNPE